MTGAGTHILYQDFVVDTVQQQTLSLMLSYRNYASTFAAPATLDFGVPSNQQFRIDLMDPSAPIDSVQPGDLLATIFQSDPGAPLSQAPIFLTYDLSAFSGATMRLRIAEVNNLGALHVAVDSAVISFHCSDATFQPRVLFPAPSYPISVASADFNGDGNLDLVLTNHDSNTVSILLGNGAGSFGPATAFPVPIGSYHLAVGDFNEDQKMDVAVAIQSGGFTNALAILLGNGDGTLSAYNSFSLIGTPVAVTPADFNEDGHLDLALATSGWANVAVMLGNGNGSFGAAANIPVGGPPWSVAVADFNNDGHLDMASANTNTDDVSIVPGNGNGTFGPALTFAVNTSPFSIAAGDFNRDGNADIVASSWPEFISVRLGNGDGTLGPLITYAVDSISYAVKIADFNGDGLLDILSINIGGATIAVLQGDGSGTFGPPLYFASGHPDAAAVADFNQDGSPDVAVANGPNDQVSILLNDCPACPAITIFPPELPDGSVGTPYGPISIVASGGTGPYTYSITNGSLPDGLTLAGIGQLSGVPTVSGTFSFVIGAVDSTGCVASMSYSIFINAPAVANDDAYTIQEDLILQISPPGVLLNDTDANQDPMVSVLDSPPANGSLTLNTNGSFTYIPQPNFFGTDSFRYHVNDGIADSNIALVTLTVIPVEDSPVAADDSYSTNEDVVLAINAPGVLSNDSDVDGDALIAILAAAPVNGTLTLNNDGSFIYVPAGNFSGIDSFTYFANDGTMNTNPATVTIHVTSVNDLPVAGDDFVTVQQDSQDNAIDVLNNDYDPEGEAIRIENVTQSPHGSIAISVDGLQLSYTPEPGFQGLDTFTYSVVDESGGSSTATVTVTVAQVVSGCLFCDDFNDGLMDSRWTYVKPAWDESDGVLVGSPSHLKAIAIAAPVFSGCRTCVIETRVETVGGGFGRLRLMGWYLNKQNAIELLIKPGYEKWILKQRVNGAVIRKTKAWRVAEPGTSCRIKLAYDGSAFLLYVNNDALPLISLVPEEPVPSGTLGFQVFNTIGKFDYVRVN